MDKVLSIQQLLLRSRRLPWVVIGLALAILAGAILATTLQIRDAIRGQISGRDGEVLYAVALMQYAEDVSEGIAEPITDPGAQLTLMLKTSGLKGVLGTRLFSPQGHFVESFPPDVREGQLEEADLGVVQRFKPASHFLPRALLSELFYPSESKDRNAGAVAPMLIVNVPLHAENGPLAGIAQFLVEGHSIAAEYARLDQHLLRQSLTAFGVGGGILALTLGWAFRRLRQANRLLAHRTENLARANEELALAAKTSALGAVTAHLLHGLKNPLAGLQTFVAAHSQRQSHDQPVDWEQAVVSTRRMQAMINQVISVMREEQAGEHYEVTLEELAETVASRVLPLSRERGVRFTTRVGAETTLPNRVANLIALILVNLAQNALQVTMSGRAAGLIIGRAPGHLVFEVRDEGGGFPTDLPLFMPCRSRKEGGSGIGLALCKQLANHLGAGLELKQNTGQGCVFALSLPESHCLEKPERESISLAD